MNFFEHQDEARRNTTRLVVLFLLAVVLIIVSLYVAVVLLLNFVLERGMHEQLLWWRPQIFLYVSAAGILLIGGGSLYKTLALRSGGGAVAQMLGGRLVDPASADPAERRLLNVVEEMALASGTSVPQVFILDNEAGMNAFAAGYELDDAAVAVTRGCLEQLNRDELQGVIAHEFSHVLNGDMRLNIRLIGVLQGILVIAAAGYMLLRAGSYGGMRRTRNKEGASVVFLIMLGGVAMLIIGYAGVIIGRLIKSAVSRQREFLADASAVQFTRNPASIAGALAKIGNFAHGSRVQNPHAEEASHLFFGSAVKPSLFESLLSTHPPIEERIRRIDPSFVDLLEQPKQPEPAAVQPSAAAQSSPAAERTQPTQKAASLGVAGVAGWQSDLHQVVNRVGKPEPQHLAHSAQTLQSLPPELLAATRELLGAVSLIYGLLLDRNAERRAPQLALLQETEHAMVLPEVLRLLPSIALLQPQLRLPLVEACAPVLRKLSPAQSAHFKKTFNALVAADQQLSLFELALKQTVAHTLLFSAPTGAERKTRFHSLKPLTHDISVLLSAIARAGARRNLSPEAAFTAGAARLFELPEARLLLPEQVRLVAVDYALDRLASAAPAIKARILDAAAQSVLADELVTLEEAELVRAIAHALNCPLPPFLPAASSLPASNA